MMSVQDQITALIAKVQAENTIIGSAMALITGLRNEIVQLQTPVPPATAPATIDPSALQALSDAIDAGAAQLAAAVAMAAVVAAPNAPVTVTVTAASTAAAPVPVTATSTTTAST